MSTAAAPMSQDILGYAELCRPGAIEYLEKHKIPQLFRSLVAALMVEQPQDHVAYIKRALARAVQVGVSNLDWETFVYGLHPKRSQQRLEFVRDGSAYERQGLELMQRRLRRGERQERPELPESPLPPPLSPAPSLYSTKDDGDQRDRLFKLTQGQWEGQAEPAASDRGNQQQQHQQRAASSAKSKAASDTQEYVSDEVDKLLSEAIVLSVAARGQADAVGLDNVDDDSVLLAQLQARLSEDLGRSRDAAGGGADASFGLFD